MIGEATAFNAFESIDISWKMYAFLGITFSALEKVYFSSSLEQWTYAEMMIIEI